jgi:hypothetical protein
MLLVLLVFPMLTIQLLLNWILLLFQDVHLLLEQKWIQKVKLLNLELMLLPLLLVTGRLYGIQMMLLNHLM